MGGFSRKGDIIINYEGKREVDRTQDEDFKIKLNG